MRYLRFVLVALSLTFVAAPGAAQDVSKAKVVPQVGHGGYANAAVSSPDGRKLLTVDDAGGLKVWDTASGRELPDGRYALSGGWFTPLTLWDVDTGAAVRNFQAPGSVVKALAFSRDGSLALSSATDGTLKLWEIATGKEVRAFPKAQGVAVVAFSADGRIAFAGADGRYSTSGPNGWLRQWEVATGKELQSPGALNLKALSPDGRLALGKNGNEALEFWNVSEGKKLADIKGISVGEMALSLDGRIGASSGGFIWDTASGRQLQIAIANAAVSSIALSPDGRILFTGTVEKDLKLWDTATGQELRSLGSDGVSINTVAFSPDGRFAVSGGEASGYTENSVNLWDMSTGKLLRALPSPGGATRWPLRPVGSPGQDDPALGYREEEGSRSDDGFGFGRVADHDARRHFREF
jgi:WD40 repeat protein